MGGGVVGGDNISPMGDRNPPGDREPESAAGRFGGWQGRGGSLRLMGALVSDAGAGRSPSGGVAPIEAIKGAG